MDPAGRLLEFGEDGQLGGEGLDGFRGYDQNLKWPLEPSHRKSNMNKHDVIHLERQKKIKCMYKKEEKQLGNRTRKRTGC